MLYIINFEWPCFFSLSLSLNQYWIFFQSYTFNKITLKKKWLPIDSNRANSLGWSQWHHINLPDCRIIAFAGYNRSKHCETQWKPPDPANRTYLLWNALLEYTEREREKSVCGEYTYIDIFDYLCFNMKMIKFWSKKASGSTIDKNVYHICRCLFLFIVCAHKKSAHYQHHRRYHKWYYRNINMKIEE